MNMLGAVRNIYNRKIQIRILFFALIVVSLVAALLFNYVKAPQIIEKKYTEVTQVTQVNHRLIAGNLIKNSDYSAQKGYYNSRMKDSSTKQMFFSMEHFVCPGDLETELLEYLIIFSFLFGNCNIGKKLIIHRIRLSRRIQRLNISHYLHEKDGKKRTCLY